MDGSGPGERLGVGVVSVEVFHDGLDQVRDTLEGAAADSLLGNLGEPAFH